MPREPLRRFGVIFMGNELGRSVLQHGERLYFEVCDLKFLENSSNVKWGLELKHYGIIWHSFSLLGSGHNGRCTKEGIGRVEEENRCVGNRVYFVDSPDGDCASSGSF